MKVRLSMFAGACALALLIAFVSYRCSGGISRAKMLSIYGFEAWTPKQAYQRSANNWWNSGIMGCLAGIPVVTNEVSSSSEKLNVFWETENPPRDGHLLVVEVNDFSSAVDAMMQKFSRCAAVQPFPRAQGVFATIGDVCFTGYPQGCSNCFKFVRNNVFVSVDASDYCVASNLAFTIDAAILNASTNAPGM